MKFPVLAGRAVHSRPAVWSPRHAKPAGEYLSNSKGDTKDPQSSSFMSPASGPRQLVQYECLLTAAVFSTPNTDLSGGRSGPTPNVLVCCSNDPSTDMS